VKAYRLILFCGERACEEDGAENLREFKKKDLKERREKVVEIV